MTIQTLFSGLSGTVTDLVGASNGQTIPVLSQVGLDDGSYYTFAYTSYAQVNRITHYAADNHELAHTSYNLPSSGKQTGCPRFTQRNDYAENWNNGAEAITTFSIGQFANWTKLDNTTDSGLMSQVFGPKLGSVHGSRRKVSPEADKQRNKIR